MPLQPYAGREATDVALRDGSTVRVRPVRPQDEPGLFALLRDLSAESQLLRFFATPKEATLAQAARTAASADQRLSFGLVATHGSEGRLVGHAFYASDDGRTAEVAFAVAESFQGKGLGTLLLGQLAQAAVACGIQAFEAEVLPHNHRMLAVFRDAGFRLETSAGAGQIHVAFPTELTEEALARFDDRERAASVAAMRAFFEPRSVAVIGASRDPLSLGGACFRNLLRYGFAGPVYPVNQASAVVQSVPAYASVLDVPGPVDLAVLVVPAAHAVEAARQCGEKGVRGVVAISAGFAETGPAGRSLQDELMAVCRRYGIRLVGPNCMGILTTDPAVRLDASFAPELPREGTIAFSSQSGALGKAVMEHAASLGLGISSFVSVGNKADISGNDLLSYWEQDPRTRLILLYLESFGNPRKFSRIARRVGRSKPVVVVKSGRTRAGTRATSSHTGALLAASDATVDALFRQAGVIRTDTLEELFDVATLLATQPPPRGRRVAILTNAGGPGILCADACEAWGLEIPELQARTQQRLRGFLPPEGSVTNPVDMIASATAEQYRSAIAIVAEDPGVDALIAIFIPPLPERAPDVARAIAFGAGALSADSGAPAKTLACVFMADPAVSGLLREAQPPVPTYLFPEAAAIAMARAARYGEWRSRPAERPERPAGIDQERALAIVATALGRGPGWLRPDEAHALLGCYGLPVVPLGIAGDAETAARAAAAMSGPVALKALLPGGAHKSDVGGVRLHLKDADEVRRAAAEIEEALRRAGVAGEGFLVQPMAPKGVEMLVGVVHDPAFGPVLACGAGGVMVELLRDVEMRLTPLLPSEAREMLRSLRTWPLLAGFRGQPPADVAALEDVLLRTSALVEDLAEIVELDLNPILVHERGASIVDARIRVEPAAAPAPIGARRS